MNISKERLITSIVLVVFLLLVGFLDNKYLTLFVISIISILAMFEAKRLFFIKEDLIFYFLALLSIFTIFVNPFFIGVLGVLAVAGHIAFYQKDIKDISLSIYPFLPLAILSALYLKGGIGMIGFLIVVVALTDSFAYLIGKNFGKKFISIGFSPTSPNKTWEGVIGGVLVGSIVGSIVGLYFFDFLNSMIISILVSLFSVLGDLFESFLKRLAGVKDSGNILPGHGGILDRIDGYLFSAPLLYSILIAMGH